MEIFELRYFTAVAQEENLHRAARHLNVSPASLSKAIARLEAELDVQLFAREGRNIRLSDHGRRLQRRATEILHLEESTRAEITGPGHPLRARFAGPEVLLSHWGTALAGKLRKLYPTALSELNAADESVALEQVARGEVHAAVISGPDALGLHARTLGEVAFVTCVGPTHPLYTPARKGKRFLVAQVLEHDFVRPSHSLLGHVGPRQSTDGWRDDKFPRRVGYLTSSLKLLESVVSSGQALAYLPDYLAEQLGLEVLSMTDCPYTCKQTVRLVMRNPKEIGWLQHLV